MKILVTGGNGMVGKHLQEILPEAIGRSLVLKTFASNSLSNISLTMQPADLIKTDPKKNKTK